MADDNQPVTGNGENETPKPGQTTTGAPTPIASLPEDIQTLIHELREESKKRRIALAQAEEQKLIDDKKWQELAETRKRELEELQPFKDRVELLEKGLNDMLEARLKTIPTDVRKTLVEPVRKTMTPTDFSRWLDLNEALLRTKTPPDPNAGAGASVANETNFGLTPEQLEHCKLAHIDPAKYAAQLKSINRAGKPA